MSIEANMKAVIEQRKGNFYSQFDKYAYTTATYDADPTSEFYGLTALEILEEEELFGHVPDEVLEWAKLQKKSQRFVSQGDPDFEFVPTYEIDENDPASEKPVQSDEDRKKEAIYNARVARAKGLKITIEANANIYYTADEASDFFGYTYDEILGMHANGVSIPDEVLDWANSMADENSTETNENTEGSDAQTLYTSLKNSPFMNIKTITKIFVKRSDEETKELEEILETLEPIEREMAAATVDVETKRERSVNNIENLTHEWLLLEAKIEKGEQLEASEQERFEELQELFGVEDDKYQEAIDDTTKNYNKFNAFLDTALIQSDVALDFGNKTVEVASELADFEKTSKKRGIFGGLVAQGIAGVLSAWGLVGSRNFAQVAHTIGLGTVHFASDVQTTIAEVNALMSETAENARFEEDDPNHKVDSLLGEDGSKRVPVGKQKTNTSEGLDASEDETDNESTGVVLPQAPAGQEDETTSAPVDGATEGAEGSETTEATEGSETAPEASDEEEQVNDQQLQAEGEKNLEDVNAKELSHGELKRLIVDEGIDSAKKGKDALKLVEDLKAQSQQVEDKADEAEDANKKVDETSNDAIQGGAENANSTEEGMTEDGAEEVSDAEGEAQDSAAELETENQEQELTIQGVRDTFKGFEKANTKYTKDVNHADKRMKEDIYTGAFTIAGGGYMAGVGVADIATGSALITTGVPMLSNPFTAAAGAALITSGTSLVTVGNTFISLGGMMIAGGTSLTVSAVDGLDVNEMTKSQIQISGEDITTATTNLDEFEATQVEPTEGEEGAQKTEETEEKDEENQEDTEDPYLSKDEKLLLDMGQGIKTLPPMMAKANKEGNISLKAGVQNIADLVGLTRQIPSLIESTITFETEKQAKEASEAAGDAEDASQAAAQDPAEIYAKYRTDFNADLKQNAEFKKDIKETQETATDNLELGAMGTLAGTARTALGSSEIALGTVLAANFWNPLQVMLGLALIKKGTEDLALGTAMLATGMALTVTSTATLAVGVMSDLKVDDSNEKTNFALDKVDEIEKQINDAVKEQMAQEGGGQNLKGMSVIQLLTVIIANGIKSEGLNAENTELFEALKEQVPEIMENITGDETVEENPEETAKNAESNAEEAEDAPAGDAGQGAEGAQAEKSPFTKYITDFQKDLKTNTVYANEVKQAANQKLSIKSGFFLGAPVEKANAKIQQSIQQTQSALDETLKMEADYNKAVEEAKAQKEEMEQGSDAGAAKIAAKDKKASESGDELPSNEDAVKNSGAQEKEAAQAVKDDEKNAEKNVKKAKKQEKKEKATTKKIKKVDKQTKQVKKESERLEKDAEEQNKQGEAEEAKGIALGENSGQEEGAEAGAQAEAQLAETQVMSAEAQALAAEMVAKADETKSFSDAKLAENQAINAEMQSLNNELQQDQAKMRSINTKLKKESKDGGSDNKPAQAPAQQPTAQQQQPQPATQPQQPAPAKKAKKSKKVEPKVEEEKAENKPAQAPAQQPQAVVTEQEKPEGADKTQYASDANKAPDFVGFVAQSDSLASGAVLAGKTKKTPTSNNKKVAGQNKVTANNNAQQTQAQKKAQTKAKAEAKKEEQEENKAQQQAQKQASQQQKVQGAARNTQKPFDIASMSGGAGGGGGKTQQLKQSAQQIQAQAFNRQAKLSAMAVRASNNVQETIRKEAEAQAEAARKQREEQEKQEKIAKIKEYAGYVQGLGGIITMTGFVTSGIGKIVENVGLSLVESGSTLAAQGVAALSYGATEQAFGTVKITVGTTEITIGSTQIGTGTVTVTTGVATETAGITTETVGTALITAGTTLLTNPFTAAAGAAMVTAGGTTTGSGVATTASGVALMGSGAGQITTGSTQTVKGGVTTTEGTATVAKGAMTTAQGNAALQTGVTNIITGTAKAASGVAIQATGGVIQSVGAYTTAAGALVSSGADFANGNILGGLATIVGAAASVVGVNLPVGTLAQAGIQAAAGGIQSANLLVQMNQDAQNQQGNQNKKQPNQKKMKKIQNDQKTNNIVNKTAKKAQAVGNRFNK